MSCIITDNFELDCLDSLGGAKQLFIFAGTYVPATVSAGVLTSLNNTSGTWYEFPLVKDTATFTEASTVSSANGTVFYTPEFTATFLKMNAEKRNQLLLLAKARDTRFVYVDANDQWWLVGDERGCTISAMTGTTGTAIGDANSYTVTLQGMEPEMAIPFAVGEDLCDVITFTGSTVTVKDTTGANYC